MNKMRNILMVLVLVMVTACGNQQEGSVCFKSDGTVTPNASIPYSPDYINKSNAAAGTLQSISDYLVQKQIISSIVEKLRMDLFGANGNAGKAAEMFTAIAGSSQFQSAIAAAFALYVIFYGMGVIGGYIQASTGDAVIRVAKMGFISVMAFSWADFYNLIGSFFVNSRDDLISYLMSSVGGAAPGTGMSSIFTPLDLFIAKIFSPHMLAILSALFDMMGQKSGPYAIGYGLLLATGLMALFSAIMNVVTVYIFSLFANVILFAVAPIYLCFLLFEKTKEMFDAWLKQLVNYNLQPILATLFLALFFKLLSPFLDEILGLSVMNSTSCDSKEASCWKLARLEGGNCKPYSIGTNDFPMSLQTILLFVFFAWCFKAYIKITGAISVALTGSMLNLSDIGTKMYSGVTRGMFGK